MSRKINIFEDAEPARKPMELKPGMVCAGTRNGLAGTADHLPTVYRAGALEAYKLPSRIGRRLYYPDGRVEVLA
jgi:hypothetical protein